MVHFIEEHRNKSPFDEKLRTDYGGEWDFQIAYNSDSRIVLRFYRYEDDELVEERYVNLDRRETQELFKFISEVDNR